MIRSDAVDVPDVDLSFSRTVPCALAHRRALGEVFVADSTQVDRDEFVLAVQVPRAHSLWGDRRIDVHDPFAMGEAARQSVFVLVHQYLGIPREQPFTLRSFTLRVVDLTAFADDRRTPQEGLLRYRTRNRSGLSTGVGVLTLRGELFLAGRLAMEVTAEVVGMPPDDYEVMRAFQRARQPDSEPVAPVPTVPPGLVGRYDERNVVVGVPVDGGSGEVRCRLVLDEGHPSFFDHAYDHLPGPVAVEGLRQAAVLAATGAGALPHPVSVVTGCEVAFSTFGQLDHPLECTARVRGVTADGSVEVAVAMYQFDEQLIDGTITLVSWPVVR
ncbi:AfsA-related hotdog domain-containing protein [Micromonospora sp. NPDC023956]|uniref:AfsA-related hotdog domain-containing protein n=1 Tax=Micromonospora sp. NPDC023956 TaxID=3155722 RepID=UPI0033EA7913